MLAQPQQNDDHGQLMLGHIRAVRRSIPPLVNLANVGVGVLEHLGGIVDGVGEEHHDQDHRHRLRRVVLQPACHTRGTTRVCQPWSLADPTALSFCVCLQALLLRCWQVNPPREPAAAVVG